MTESKTTSFGRYLRAVRLEKNIRLEEVAARTRIGVDTLQAIEDEDVTQLPADVFVKGFLRSFARVIDADGDLAVENFSRHAMARREAEKYQDDMQRASSQFWRHFLLGLGVLVMIMAVSVETYHLATSSGAPGVASQAAVESERKAAPAVSAEAVKADTHPEPAEAVGAAPEAEPADAAADAGKAETTNAPRPISAGPKLRLAIDTVETTWLKINLDHLNSREYSLRPGDHVELQADEKMDLLIGNAAGVRLTLNGEAVPLRGKSGQVITIQLP